MTPEDIPAEVFSGKPHRLSMGLRPLDLTTWLDSDAHDPQMSRRRELLVRNRSEVVAHLPGSEEASSRVARAVADWVGVVLPGAEPPLVEAAMLVRDDLCVLAPMGDTWRLVAAVVCFPSRWRLADKLGQDVLAIHDPVPRYRSELGAATNKVFGTISAGAARWRVNWTLLNDPELFQPVAPAGPRHRPGTDSYLRVERQCLVPVDDVIAFTIRTTVRGVRELTGEQARAVMSSAEQTPDDLAAYRGWAK